jgi:hypothetical protein
VNGRKLKKNDFTSQLLRMVVALGLSMRSVANVELQRAFHCLTDDILFSFPFTMKNHLLVRSKEIISLLLKELLNDGIKVCLALDCWSSYNKQGYMAINAYFIDERFKWHEVLLAFEHVTGSHIGIKLAEVLNNVVVMHFLESRILAITTDSAFNNTTMLEELTRMIKANRALAHLHLDVYDILRVFCLAHVIQLVVKELLGHIRINLKNVEFQRSWDERQDRQNFEREEAGVSHILAKASIILDCYILW